MANSAYALAVATEVRAELGRQRRSASWLARELGQSQSKVSRRLVGDQAFDLDELERVAAVLNVPITKFVIVPTRSDSGDERRSSMRRSTAVQRPPIPGVSPEIFPRQRQPELAQAAA